LKVSTFVVVNDTRGEVGDDIEDERKKEKTRRRQVRK